MVITAWISDNIYISQLQFSNQCAYFKHIHELHNLFFCGNGQASVNHVISLLNSKPLVANEEKPETDICTY